MNYLEVEALYAASSMGLGCELVVSPIYTVAPVDEAYLQEQQSVLQAWAAAENQFAARTALLAVAFEQLALDAARATIDPAVENLAQLYAGGFDGA